VVTTTQADIEALQADPSVLTVQDDPKRYLAVVKNSDVRDRHRDSPSWKGQATPYGIELVQAYLARDAGLTGAGVKVCVIDTGFDMTHNDFHSANFTGDSLVPNNNWFADSNGHGTHVTGTIAVANNYFGLVVVAPNAMIHMVGVFDAIGATYSSSLVNAAYYKCRDAGAKIISMSLGGDIGPAAEQDVFSELYTQNGIFVHRRCGKLR
jgi:serine protease